MKNKLLKILILIVTIILLFGSTQVFATAPYENPGFYEPDIEKANNTSFTEKVNKILGLISMVGTVCSVVIVAIIGLRYMLGSVDEKAEYKKTMIGYLIGALLLFSATTLPNILYDIGQSIGGQSIGEPPNAGTGTGTGGFVQDLIPKPKPNFEEKAHQ